MSPILAVDGVLRATILFVLKIITSVKNGGGKRRDHGVIRLTPGVVRDCYPVHGPHV
jgi:hypothetical protein